VEWLAAIFGLLGVLVGGIVTFGIERWKARQEREQADEDRRQVERTALLLIYHDLILNQSMIEWTLDNRRWEPAVTFSTDAWQSWRETFTRSPYFGAMATAYSGIEISVQRRLLALEAGNPQLENVELDGLRPLRV
jgi:hypothetical protein